MSNVKVWMLSSGCWMAITFTVCVIGGVIAPGLPIPHRTLELLLPGFTWLSLGSFALGLLETFLFGAYAAWLFVSLHNVFGRRERRSHTVRKAA
jgi:uncharacterized protein DUF5676